MLKELRISLCFLVVVAALPANADAPQFSLPVDCAYGDTCFIQNYFDHDAGPGRADYACGRLSYDGHDGTDFRTRDDVEMRRGVAVVAAAPGTVRAVRDGMDDVRLKVIGRAAIKGREAGNGVVIVHEDGWETQYSHLRKGSVAVKPGDRVEAGTQLGLIGMSGAADFPHVEFAVRHNGVAIDPFVGDAGAYRCGTARRSLWGAKAERELAYIPTGLLVAGFSAGAPVPDEARRGGDRLGVRADNPDALVFWVDVFGAEAGDVEALTIIAPDGTAIVDHRATLERSNVSWFSYAGTRRPASGWPAGLYQGRYTLERRGSVLVDHAHTIEIGR